MDYIEQWERMRSQSEKLKNRVQLLYSLDNKYGFRLNINHPAIREKFEDFKKSKNIGRYGMRDELRYEFEEKMLESNYFKKLLKEEEEKFGPAYEYIKRHGRWPDLEQQEDKKKVCVYLNQD